MADNTEHARTRRLLAASLLLGGLLLGLLLPRAWTGGGIVRAAPDAVYKCVGFSGLDLGKHVGFVRFHNDSTTEVRVTVYWLGPKGQYIWGEAQILPAGWTGEAQYWGGGDVRVAQLTAPSPVLIIDAEEEYNVSPENSLDPRQHRQVTCSPATTMTLNR
jgi:hypothetical protein